MGEDLKNLIEEDFKRAVLKRDDLEISVLKLLRAEIFKRGKEKEYREKDRPKEEQALTNKEIIEILRSEIKKRQEAISLFEKGGRNDLKERELKEIAILSRYLPPLLTDKELEKIVLETIEKLSPQQRNLKIVMNEIINKWGERVDKKILYEVAKKHLQKMENS